MGLMEMEKKLFTYEEYRALELPQGQDAEFVEGEIIMRYRPTLEHQEILGNLFYALKDYLKGKPCKVLPEAEVDLFANQTQIRIPDILINCKNERDKRTHIEGAPEIVIEIVSKSSITQDYIIKTAAYQQAGVKEYWIVDPLKKIVSLYFFQVDAFLDSGLPIRLKEMTDILHSKELSEFEMTLEEIFNQ